MNAELLTRTECNVMRGLAILGIFLHNYCHWLNPVVKENEYQYSQHNVDWLMQVCAHPDALLPMHIISFFGHYGVPIFLFLSAFGLERKYGNTKPGPRLEPKVNTWGFIRYHFLKLFKMMIVGFICFTIVDAITPDSWHYTMVQIFTQLGMVNNFLAHPDDNIWPGPYWFFGLMLQLYLVYRLLLYRHHWGWTAGLMAVCLGIQMTMGPESEAINYYRYNFMGGMLPFGLGILFARYGERIMLVRMNFGGALMSWVVCSFFIVSMSTNYYAWAFIPAMVCYATVYFVKTLSLLPMQRLRDALWYVFSWLGSISAALFVIHPVLRKVFIPISRYGDYYTGLLLYVITSLGVAWLLKEVMKKIPSPKEVRIKS